MSSISQAIREEASTKHIPIQDNRSKKVYELFDGLYRLSPVNELELEFERQLFTRGTGSSRVGLHTSAIIDSEKHYCCREQVLSLLYEPRNMQKDLPTPTLRIFEEGNYIHRKWQRLFLRGKLANVKDLDVTCFNKQYMLGFSPDAIIEIKGRKFIVEVKSMNEFAYKRVDRHLSGEKQCRMYMFLSGIEHGIVLMENKNNQDFKITMLEHDESLIGDYISRLEEVVGYYETKCVPERHEGCKTSLSKRCLDCPMSAACWGTKEERQLLRLPI